MERIRRTNPRDAESRHKFLVESLVERRAFQRETLGNSGDVELYQRLLEPFVELSGGFKLFEVVSDGLGAPDPHWDAAALNNTEFKLERLPPDRRGALNDRVIKMRQRLEGLQYDTHRSLGRVLLQPCLFAISGRASSADISTMPVRYFADGSWVDLVRHPDRVPFKPDTSPEQETSRVAAVETLANCLQSISRRVIWPAFWREFDASEYLTLLYIQASSVSASAGVWALHIGAESAGRVEASNSEGPEEGSFRTTLKNDDLSVQRTWQVVTPPMNCLLDSLTLVLDEGGLEARRSAELRLLALAAGYDAVFAKGSVDILLKRLGKPAEAVYHEDSKPDLILHHSFLLESASSIMEVESVIGNIPGSEDVDDDLNEFLDGTALGFSAIGILLRSTCYGDAPGPATGAVPGVPKLPLLLTREAVRLLSQLVTDTAALDIFLNSPIEAAPAETLTQVIAYAAVAAAIEMILRRPSREDASRLLSRAEAILNCVAKGFRLESDRQSEPWGVARDCLKLGERLEGLPDQACRNKIKGLLEFVQEVSGVS